MIRGIILFPIAKGKNVTSVSAEEEKEVEENAGVEMSIMKSDAKNVEAKEKKLYTLQNLKVNLAE